MRTTVTGAGWSARAARAALVTVVAALSVPVVASPAAAASTFPPLRVPSSVQVGMDTWSPWSRAAAAGAAGSSGAVVGAGTAATAGGGALTWGTAAGAAGAGPVGVVSGVGLVTGFASGSWFLGTIPDPRDARKTLINPDDLGVSGLAQIIGMQPAPGPDFVADQGVVPAEPGFKPTSSIVGAYRFTNGTIKLDVTAALRVIGTEPSVPVAGPLTVEVKGWTIAGSGFAVHSTDVSYSFDFTLTTTCKNAGGSSTISGGNSRVTLVATKKAGTTNFEWTTGLKEAVNPGCPAGTEWVRTFLSPGQAADATNIPTTDYNPIGAPFRPGGVASSPTRWWETRWTCNGAPASLRSAAFHETDAMFPAFPQASCPPGVMPDAFEVWQITEGMDPIKVLGGSVTPGAKTWAEKYPQCVTGACTLEVYRTDGGQKLSCLSNAAACTDWWTDPARDAKYQCWYAGAPVAMTECAAYATTFNVVTNTPVRMPDGSTKPATEVARTADPATGNPIAVPAASPGTGTGTATGPAAGDCPPPFEMTLGGIGYWVTKGVSCALEWAFVPSPATTVAMADAGAMIGARAPYPEIKSLVVWVMPPASLPPACLVAQIEDKWLTKTTVTVFDACGEGVFERWLRANRWLTGAAAWFAFAVPIVWWAWRQYAPGSQGPA